MVKSSLDHKERSSPSTGLVSQSLIIKKSLNYFGVESRFQGKKFEQFPLHPLYKFPVVHRGKSDLSYLQRSSFTISNTINIKQSLVMLHSQSPFSNSNSLREIIQESSLGFIPESVSLISKPPIQLNPYQSSIESFDFSDLSLSENFPVSRSIPNGRLQTPMTYAIDVHKEATLDTGLSFSSIKSDEVVYNSDTLEVSNFEWDELKERKFSENKEDDEFMSLVDEGPRYSTTDHMFLSGETASKERLLRKKSVPLFKDRNLNITADMSSPIIRKLVICRESKEGKVVQSRESSVEVKSAHILKAIPVSGYLSVPSLAYSNQEGKSKAFIQYSDNHMISLLLSKNILTTTLKASVELISCGSEHIAMLSTFGKIFTLGYGASGVLGHGDILSCIIPRMIESLSGIVYVECGAYHTATIDENGKIWVWGRGDVGQLGVSVNLLTKDFMGVCALKPLIVEELAFTRVKTVACGQAHTLALDENGVVYSFGWGDDGQLGLMPSELLSNIMTLNVKKINFLHVPIVKISAGASFSACVSDTGEVFVWGSGEKGQLGLGDKVKFSYFPNAVEWLRKEDVIDVTCGEQNVICVSRAGKGFGWGLGVVENLGDNEVYPKGSEVVCFVPRVLEEIDIAHRIIIVKPSV